LNSPGNRARGRLAKRLVCTYKTNNTYEKRREEPELVSLWFTRGSLLSLRRRIAETCCLLPRP